MMCRYAVKLAAEPEGGFLVTLPAFPEVTTEAETHEAALAQAADALEEAASSTKSRCRWARHVVAAQ